MEIDVIAKLCTDKESIYREFEFMQLLGRIAHDCFVYGYEVLEPGEIASKEGDDLSAYYALVMVSDEKILFDFFFFFFFGPPAATKNIYIFSIFFFSFFRFFVFSFYFYFLINVLGKGLEEYDRVSV